MHTEKAEVGHSKGKGIFTSSFLNLAPFICSLMVIAIHQHNTIAPLSSVQSRIISFFTHGICTAAVPVFMMLSGYLFFRNADTLQQVFQKQKKRILTVLLPFLVWSALYYAFFVVSSCFVPGVLQNPMDISFLGIIRGVIFYEYAFPLWYMFQLCVYIALTPIIFFILKNKTTSLIALITAAGLGLAGIFNIDIHWNGLERSLFQVNFFAYFLFGCILAGQKEWEQRLYQFAKAIPWVVIVVLVVGFSVLGSIVFDELLPAFNNRVVVPAVFACILFLFIKLGDRFAQIAKPRTSTMILYGVHPVIGIVLNEVLFARLQLGALVQFLLSIITVMAGSFMAAWVIRRIKPIHRILSGNR